MANNITNLNVGGRQFDVDSLLKNAQNPSEEQEPPVQEASPEEEAVEAVDSYALTHKDEWLQDLRLNRIELKTAHKILDTIMQKGFYEESYRIAGSIFKLRTRTTVDSDRLIEMLRELSPESEAVASHLIARVNVASSLSKFGDNNFPHTNPSDENRELLDQEWRLRWSYISSLPQPIFLAIAQTMQRFDLKVNLACDARALENF
tara:strand:- start:1326 stop:1940 length:615 start_codon:yes stop_codon:yes gene_type:complete